MATDLSWTFRIGFLTLNISPYLLSIIIISGLVGNWLFAIRRNALCSGADWVTVQYINRWGWRDTEQILPHIIRDVGGKNQIRCGTERSGDDEILYWYVSVDFWMFLILDEIGIVRWLVLSQRHQLNHLRKIVLQTSANDYKSQARAKNNAPGRTV